MLFDFASLSAPDRYKLLTATIVPRPIAWVVSQDVSGRVNAAPFSFFNAFGEDPPVIAVSVGPRRADAFKDTGANIRATGQFVVNLVPEALMHAMHVTAIEFGPEVDELAEAGLATLPSTHVAPPRIAASPVALECERHTLVELGQGRTLAIGLVLAMHVDDRAVLDAPRLRIDTPALGLVGRSFGPGGYVRAAGPDMFVEPRLRLEDWTRRT